MATKGEPCLRGRVRRCPKWPGGPVAKGRLARDFGGEASKETEENCPRLAEGEGFEPPHALRRLLISIQVPLTTQPPFRCSSLLRFRAILGRPIVFETPRRHPRDMQTTDRAAAVTKTNVTNLRCSEPSATYYLLARIGGKLKRKSPRNGRVQRRYGVG